MINHARTLLMNVDGADGFMADPGEEIIPASYKAVPLTGSLMAIRNELFGSTPDRIMLNYRTRQLMAMLHCTELLDHVISYDGRITYDFDDSPFMRDSLFDSHVQLVSGPAEAELYVIGTDSPPDATGKMFKVWDIAIETGTFEAELRNPKKYQSYSYTMTDNLSDLHTLPGTSLQVRFNNTTFSPGEGPLFRLEKLTRPERDLSTIATRLSQLPSNNVLNDLFGIGTQVGEEEPLKTYRNLWQKHEVLSYKLGGLILALIHRTELRRLR